MMQINASYHTIIHLFHRVSELYSGINDTDLDRLVLEIQREHPRCGYRMMRAFLQASGHLIQCKFVFVTYLQACLYLCVGPMADLHSQPLCQGSPALLLESYRPESFSSNPNQTH